MDLTLNISVEDIDSFSERIKSLISDLEHANELMDQLAEKMTESVTITARRVNGEEVTRCFRRASIRR